MTWLDWIAMTTKQIHKPSAKWSDIGWMDLIALILWGLLLGVLIGMLWRAL